jgi:hypothetical protein
MPSLGEQNPHRTFVQGGLRGNNFVNAKYCVICSGPPNFADVGAAVIANGANSTADVVFPVGLVQTFSIGQNKQFNKVFEVGSDRSVSLPGRSVTQVSMSRVLWHGPSLLRCLYAYYATGPRAGTYPIDPLFASAAVNNPLNFPFAAGANGLVAQDLQGSQVKVKDGLHSVKLPPGYDNAFYNLQSDLFDQPIGLLVVLKDNEEEGYASFYLENVVIPAFSFGFDAQGLQIGENVSLMPERIIPIRTGGVKVVDGLRPDLQGARAY